MGFFGLFLVLKSSLFGTEIGLLGFKKQSVHCAPSSNVRLWCQISRCVCVYVGTVEEVGQKRKYQEIRLLTYTEHRGEMITCGRPLRPPDVPVERPGSNRALQIKSDSKSVSFTVHWRGLCRVQIELILKNCFCGRMKTADLGFISGKSQNSPEARAEKITMLGC